MAEMMDERLAEIKSKFQWCIDTSEQGRLPAELVLGRLGLELLEEIDALKTAYDAVKSIANWRKERMTEQRATILDLQEALDSLAKENRGLQDALMAAQSQPTDIISLDVFPADDGEELP